MGKALMAIIVAVAVCLVGASVAWPQSAPTDPAWSASQAADPFGQSYTVDVNAQVDKAKNLRLPYDKTPDQAKTDAAAAARVLEGITATNPNYYRAYFNLGLAYDQAGDYAKANTTFNTALLLRDKFSIKDITLLNSAGWVSMQNADYATAEKRFLLALQNIDQGTPYTKAAVYNNLGQLYFFTQRFDEATKYLKIAHDQFGSQGAADTLGLIAKTQAIVDNKKAMAN